MPCIVETEYEVAQATSGRIKTLEGNVARLEATLCALLSSLEASKYLKSTLDSIDYLEAGISRDRIESWWKSHKKKDSVRRAREAKARIELERQYEKYYEMSSRPFRFLDKPDLLWLKDHDSIGRSTQYQDWAKNREAV